MNVTHLISRTEKRTQLSVTQFSEMIKMKFSELGIIFQSDKIIAYENNI